MHVGRTDRTWTFALFKSEPPSGRNPKWPLPQQRICTRLIQHPGRPRGRHRGQAPPTFEPGSTQNPGRL
ncbi:hypothetical protein CUU62_27240 [Pseudomonas sp. WP001]|nr:hypothetical protein CUU62_27240 [Pseudomonas sp. WP001]